MRASTPGRSGGRLAPAFTGEIERWEDDRVTRGFVVLLPGALVHRAPDGGLRLHVFDRASGFYLAPGERVEPADEGTVAGAP